MTPPAITPLDTWIKRKVGLYDDTTLAREILARYGSFVSARGPFSYCLDTSIIFDISYITATM